MKPLAALMFAAVLIFGAEAPAGAAEVAWSGVWEVGLGWAKNVSFYDGGQIGEKTNSFAIVHCFRPQLDVAFSETLRSTLALQVSSAVAGRDRDPHAENDLTAEFVRIIQLREAYFEWAPGTGLDARAGVYNAALPSAAFGNPVWNDDAAGVALGYAFNDTLTLNMLWARPFESNLRRIDARRADRELNVFALDLPMAGERFSVTPWGAYAHTGQASRFWNYRSDHTAGFNLTDLPATGDMEGSSGFWWAGAAADLRFLEPFSLKIDAMYGEAKGGPEFSGWLAAGLFEYDSGGAWGRPGLTGWQASGDKAESYQRGEYGKFGRLPVIGADRGGFAPAAMGYPGSEGCMTDSLISFSASGTTRTLRLAKTGILLGIVLLIVTDHRRSGMIIGFLVGALLMASAAWRWVSARVIRFEGWRVGVFYAVVEGFRGLWSIVPWPTGWEGEVGADVGTLIIFSSVGICFLALRIRRRSPWPRPPSTRPLRARA
jgi:hypothetical protein